MPTLDEVNTSRIQTPDERAEEAARISQELGLRMVDYIENCWKQDSPLVYVVCGLGLSSLVATFVIALRHRARLQAAPISVLRLQYMRVLWFPPVLALTSFISLLCPRAFILCKMLQEQAEALTLMYFGLILFMLLAQESYLQCKDDGSEEDIAAKIVRALAAQGPKKHFGVPPFGCLFRQCMRAHHLLPRHLVFARFLFQQYAFTVVATSILTNWCALSLTVDQFHAEHKVAGIIVKISGFFAIYGLMVLYVATHDLLARWRTTSKFVAIKLVVLFITFQELLTGPILKHVNMATCVGTLASNYDPEVIFKHREHFYNMLLLCIESVLVAHLVARAFPATEIRDFAHEPHMLGVNIALERLAAAPASQVPSGSDSDEDEVDDDGDDHESDRQVEDTSPSKRVPSREGSEDASRSRRLPSTEGSSHTRGN